MEGELCVPPEALFVLPQGGAADAPKYQVIIWIVHGVPGIHLTKYTAVRTQDVVCLGVHPPPYPYPTPRPPVSFPRALAQKKVHQNILN